MICPECNSEDFNILGACRNCGRYAILMDYGSDIPEHFD